MDTDFPIGEQIQKLHHNQEEDLSQYGAFRASEAGSFENYRLYQALKRIRSEPIRSYKPLLPLLLNLKGKPFHINNHFPFEPHYRRRMPRVMVTKAGRQVGKSSNLAAKGVILSNAIPNFSTLYITPLYEMIRRFSNNYVRRFIDESPVRKTMLGERVERNVLQRSFRNKSMMFFSFAFLDADRTRGIWADKVSFDEIQDLDPDHIPIIMETMSASPWKITEFNGTPKTIDNTCEIWWQDSSQAEWVIRCGCGKENWPCLDGDLEKMIGPPSDDICETRPGVVCAKCSRPIDPKTGRWIHRIKERRWDVAGYHVPQLILPMHYADPEAWAVLWGKRHSMPYNVFLNEVLGESCDVGAKLVTVTDLRKVAHLGPNKVENALKRIHSYTTRILAIDWGGGGEDMTSYTTYAVMGLLPDGKIDVIYGHRSMTPNDHIGEAKLALELVRVFQCSHLAHDYSGAGSLRETLILQAGYPVSRVIPIAYVRSAAQTIMLHKPPTKHHPRHYYTLDKPRALNLTCQYLRLGKIRFFDYDYKSKDQPGLLHDFLALREEKVDRRIGSDLYIITRNPKHHDDFAQAVNIGCCSLWHINQAWPDIASEAKFMIDQEDFLRLMPREDQDWDFDGPYSGPF